MSEDKVIDRVRKLLRVAQDPGATQDEAETALLLAQRLMAEHALDEARVEELPDAEEIVSQQADEVGRTEGWRAGLSKVVAANFRCRSYWSVAGPGERAGEFRKHRTFMMFVGHRSDAEVAAEVYRCAVEVALREVKRHVHARGHSCSRQDPEGRVMWNEFLAGFRDGLASKYEAQVRSSGWGLVVATPRDVEERMSQMDLRFVGSRVTMGDVEARSAGKEAGKRFSPTRKVPPTGEKPKLIGK